MYILKLILGIIINIFVSGFLATYICYLLAILGKDYYGRIHDYWQLGIFVLCLPIMFHFVKKSNKVKKEDNNGTDKIINESIEEANNSEKSGEDVNELDSANEEIKPEGKINTKKASNLSNGENKNTFKRSDETTFKKNGLMLGNEPEDIQLILKPFLQELVDRFPNKVIIWNEWNHSRWDKAANYLCKSLGFSNGSSFLEAYGFKVIVGSSTERYCSSCGKNIPENSVYCPYCGRKI